MLVDLTSQISLLKYYQTTDSNGFRKDYVYYLGSPLDELLPAGTYYMRIVSGGVTYIWEPITVVCETFSDNALPQPPFGEGLHTVDTDTTQFVWKMGGDYPRFLSGRKNTAGAPTDPALEYNGSKVMNLGDNLLYTWNGSAWVSSTPADSLGWYDFSSGNWYNYGGGGWQGVVNDPLELTSSGACWNGDVDAPITLDLSYLECTETTVRIAIVVQGMTSGQLTVSVSDSDESIVITEDGEYGFTTYIANGYLLELTPSGLFDGCVSGLAIYCSAGISDCFYRLDWSSCGSLGNTFSGDGFTHALYLDQAVYPIRPAPEMIIESKTRADGSRMETRRRRETTWTLDLGMMPWFLADALADIPLYDTVVLNPVGGGQDRLSLVRVSVENEEDFAECFKRVLITFQNESATSACCDEFDPPCRTSCVEAYGLTSHPTPENGNPYLVLSQSAYSMYVDDTFGVPNACDSGLADITDGVSVLYSMLFDINEGAWFNVALSVDVAVYPDGGGCSINILALVVPFYRGILQYKNEDGDWVDDDQYDLTSAEWVNNNVLRVTPADEHLDKELRIMVYIGECEIGHSPVFTYACE